MDNSANVNPNIVWQQTKVAREDREETLRQRGRVVWFTGLSGSGKSTVAVEVERQLNEAGYATYLLDGDNVRHGLCRDLSFSEEDRRENIRRVSEVAGLFADAGIIVLAAFISPYRADRQSVRDLLDPGDFIEVYISTPIEVCEKRDVKGLYQKARQGKIDNFTGISAPYEPPLNPDIAVDTSTVSLEDSARLIKGTIVRTFDEAFRR